ncbi:MAG TPA: hypothetical protein VFK43_02725, partial [Acidimicrobiales bacterium]|nr:hypothetical protein [Acidimicrobiales bacterium]
RQTSRRLPAGNLTGYGYYANAGGSAAVCGRAAGVNQGGRPHVTTAPDPDGAGSLPSMLTEAVYDAAGRPVATRANADPWTCLTYDARGRILTRVVPALGAPFNTTARTVTSTYSALTATVADGAGTGPITTTVDLLGRVVSYTDAWGNRTTSAYDQPGRLTDTVTHTGLLGLVTSTHHTGYNPAGRPLVQALDNVALATACYDAAGELATVAYANETHLAGTGAACNSIPSGITRDPAGRTTGLSFNQAGAAGVLTSDVVTRSQAGRVLTTTVDGAASPASSYTYDGPGRLKTATRPGHAVVYDFAESGGCGPAADAGKNTNRTSVSDNGGTPTTHCYNHADQLTSSTDA